MCIPYTGSFLLLSHYYTVELTLCQLDSGNWTINKVTCGVLIIKYIICAKFFIILEYVYIASPYTHTDIDVDIRVLSTYVSQLVHTTSVVEIIIVHIVFTVLDYSCG